MVGIQIFYEKPQSTAHLCQAIFIIFCWCFTYLTEFYIKVLNPLKNLRKLYTFISDCSKNVGTLSLIYLQSV